MEWPFYEAGGLKQWDLAERRDIQKTHPSLGK